MDPVGQGFYKGQDSRARSALADLLDDGRAYDTTISDRGYDQRVNADIGRTAQHAF
jgi:hypothetical protein